MRSGLIKSIAEKKGITMVALAKSIGVSEQQIHRIVNSGSTKIETLEKIAQALKVSPTVFFDANFNISVLNEPEVEYKRKGAINYKVEYEMCVIEKDALNKQIERLKQMIK